MGTSGTGAYEKLLSLGLERYVAQQLDDLIAEGYYPPEGFANDVAMYFKGVNPNILSEVIIQYKSSDFTGIQDYGALLIQVARPIMGVKQDNRPFQQMHHARPAPGPQQSFKPEPRYHGGGETRMEIGGHGGGGGGGDAKASSAPTSDRMQKILDRTMYKYEVTSGQRSYGPGPGMEDFKPPKNSQCYFGKIPMEYLVEDLVEKFEQSGPIWHLRLMMNPETGRNQTYGFVTFFDAETARKCVELWDGFECQMSGRNRSIRMNVKINEPNRRLFVGPIRKEKNSEEIMAAFSAIVDGITNVEIQEPADPNTHLKNKGFCFLDFVDHKSAGHAKKRLDPGTIPIKAWNNYTGYGCAWSDPLDDPDDEVLGKIKNVYITKLTDSVSESDLEERFSRYGNVERVKKAKNFAFVDFTEREDCLRAIENEDGMQIKDAVMKCALARPVPPDSKNRLQQIREKQQLMASEGGGMKPPGGGRGGGMGGRRGGGRGGYSGGDFGDHKPPGYGSYPGGGDPYGYDRYPSYDYPPSYGRDPYARGGPPSYGRDPYDPYGAHPDPYAARMPPPAGGYSSRGGLSGYSSYDRFGGPPAAGGFGEYGRPPFGGPPPPKRNRGGF